MLVCKIFKLFTPRHEKNVLRYSYSCREYNHFYFQDNTVAKYSTRTSAQTATNDNSVDDKTADNEMSENRMGRKKMGDNNFIPALETLMASLTDLDRLIRSPQEYFKSLIRDGFSLIREIRPLFESIFESRINFSVP